MAIKIKGVIGWDVVGTQFADMISKLSGDIEFEIDSPGGSVFDGISIFNAIKNYNKGKCNMHVVGECSSMAAYIMLAGDSLKFEKNSIVVLHNPWSCACGDYKVMKEQADILERLSALYASKFVEKGIFKEPEIRSIMDAETWFIGSAELAKLGEVVESNDGKSEPLDTEIAIAAARENIKAWQSMFRQEKADDFDRIAALLPSISQPKAENQPKTPKIESNNIVQVKKEKNIMDKNELLQQHPALYAQILEEGANKEKSRVNALMPFIGIDKDTAIKAINEGKSIQDDEVQSAFMMAKLNAGSIKAMEGDNPPAVTPGEPEHAPESTDADKEKADKETKEKDEKDLKAVVALCGFEI